MTLWQFIFSFLYVRNWETGKRELSQTRLYVLLAALGILVLLAIVGYVAGSPIVFSRS